MFSWNWVTLFPPATDKLQTRICLILDDNFKLYEKFKVHTSSQTPWKSTNLGASRWILNASQHDNHETTIKCWPCMHCKFQHPQGMCIANREGQVDEAAWSPTPSQKHYWCETCSFSSQVKQTTDKLIIQSVRLSLQKVEQTVWSSYT